MSVVTNTTILKACANNVKSVIDAQVSQKASDNLSIIDPKRSSRDTKKEPFTRITAARRQIYYPHIVCSAHILQAPTLSLVGDSFRYEILTPIKIVADNVKDLDGISNSVMEVMRDSRTVFNGYGMKRPKNHHTDVTDVTPRGAGGNIKERTLSYRFVYYAQ